MDEYPQYLSPAALRPHPSLGPRLSASRTVSDWQAFVDEIRENGVEEAILFVEEEGKWFIVEGLTRWEAAVEAELTAIPCQRITREEGLQILGDGTDERG